MDFLPPANRVALGQSVEGQVTAEGKHVVVIGGGDTGADCIGTAHRQGALSVTSLEILSQPSAERPSHQPWPTYPMTFRVASAHEEGGDRVYAVSTSEIVGDEHGRAQALRLHEVRTGENGFEKVEGSERELPAQLVLLAMGFLGPQQELLEQLGVERDERSNAARDAAFMTNVPGIFVAGDAGRGQSLIVWAIAEGRSAAHEVDAWLMGKPSRLPRPVNPTDRPLMA
jgi:glutamate synthase (NADPH/NADH) small chain